jgi:hypothetical protein
MNKEGMYDFDINFDNSGDNLLNINTENIHADMNFFDLDNVPPKTQNDFLVDNQINNSKKNETNLLDFDFI